MLRYGEMEAVAIADLYTSLSAEEFVQEMITGLNLALMRGAADAFRSISEAADEKVETILDIEPEEVEDTTHSIFAGALMAYGAVCEECFRQYTRVQDDIVAIAAATKGGVDAVMAEQALGLAASEAPRVNAQVEGFDASDWGVVEQEPGSVVGPEAAR